MAHIINNLILIAMKKLSISISILLVLSIAVSCNKNEEEKPAEITDDCMISKIEWHANEEISTPHTFFYNAAKTLTGYKAWDWPVYGLQYDAAGNLMGTDKLTIEPYRITKYREVFKWVFLYDFNNQCTGYELYRTDSSLKTDWFLITNMECQWENGNMVKTTEKQYEEGMELISIDGVVMYDDKKNPLQHIPAFVYLSPEIAYGSTNNVVSVTYTSSLGVDKYTYTYQYAQNGFPLQAAVEAFLPSIGYQFNFTHQYFYICPN
jgi:YD repeat-containing protein